MNGSHVRIAAVSVWMFLGGPLVWGAWMVWRLKLMSFEEFLGCLWPAGACLLLVFLGFHLFNLNRQRTSAGRHGEKGASPVRTHCAVLTLFGTVGTTAFLLLPKLVDACIRADGTAWRMGWELVGALAGFSLIGMLYPLFSVSLFSALPGFSSAKPVLRRFNAFSFGLGLIAYVAVGLLSPIDKQPLSLVGMAVPVAMGGLLYAKSRRHYHETR